MGNISSIHTSSSQHCQILFAACSLQCQYFQCLFERQTEKIIFISKNTLCIPKEKSYLCNRFLKRHILFVLKARNYWIIKLKEATYANHQPTGT